MLVTVLPRFCRLCLRLTERFDRRVNERKIEGSAEANGKSSIAEWSREISEGLLSPRAYCVAAAVAFLIAGSGTASR